MTITTRLLSRLRFRRCPKENILLCSHSRFDCSSTVAFHRRCRIESRSRLRSLEKNDHKVFSSVWIGLRLYENNDGRRHFRSPTIALLQDAKDELDDEYEYEQGYDNDEVQRLLAQRNVGVFAHVDAGKTTVTERMLALAGIVRRAGSVDDGNTLTDFLPAERERGITIQSAAVSFPWKWHNRNDTDLADDRVLISLIDTPGHVDFSVEVNRSVAVLDGAVLVVDSVAGVQAQTETVWRAMMRTSDGSTVTLRQENSHEPLACLAVINKMDKVGCHFGSAIESLRTKLPRANPVAIQMPLFRGASSGSSDQLFPYEIVAGDTSYSGGEGGEFAGVVDLIHMRAILWPDPSDGMGGNADVSIVEHCVPIVVPLLRSGSATKEQIDPSCSVTQSARVARQKLVEALADCDERIEELFLMEDGEGDSAISNADIRSALRRATLSRRVLPVVASAALRGKGIEPLLDAVADFLPSPLDRMPPSITVFEDTYGSAKERKHAATKKFSSSSSSLPAPSAARLGHPLSASLLALAFKVVHMKGRGGSGDGRVVFARVYSGELRDRETVQVVSPPPPGGEPDQPRKERIGGMLELYGGRFGNLSDGVCKSGDVCALVGLKSVVTGDTITASPDRRSAGAKSTSAAKQRGNDPNFDVVCLSAVTTPKPVLKVRLEAETSEEQSRLSEALALLAIEDPSLLVEETESSTLLSGLGELHIEVTIDRLQREYGLCVMVGPPAVTYRETIVATIETPGLLEFDRTIGGKRLQGAVHVVLEPVGGNNDDDNEESRCMQLADAFVSVDDQVLEFLGLEDTESTHAELMTKSDLYKALVEGCLGALKRGPLGPYEMANVMCRVMEIDAEGGLKALQALPGSLRAAAANAVSTLLVESRASCTILEPIMRIEVTSPDEMVGTILSDLTSRRGTVADVQMSEGGGGGLASSKALVRGDVPLVEILGYANSLRSITAGEGVFVAEYMGHSPTMVGR